MRTTYEKSCSSLPYISNCIFFCSKVMQKPMNWGFEEYTFSASTAASHRSLRPESTMTSHFLGAFGSTGSFTSPLASPFSWIGASAGGAAKKINKNEQALVRRKKKKKKNLSNQKISFLRSPDHVVTLWILALWELDLYIVISGDLLNPWALGTHYRAVELLGNHALDGHLSVLERTMFKWQTGYIWVEAEHARTPRLWL